MSQLPRRAGTCRICQLIGLGSAALAVAAFTSSLSTSTSLPVSGLSSDPMLVQWLKQCLLHSSHSGFIFTLRQYHSFCYYTVPIFIKPSIK